VQELPKEILEDGFAAPIAITIQLGGLRGTNREATRVWTKRALIQHGGEER
jgi:hypothetical protein